MMIESIMLRLPEQANSWCFSLLIKCLMKIQNIEKVSMYQKSIIETVFVTGNIVSVKNKTQGAQICFQTWDCHLLSLR